MTTYYSPNFQVPFIDADTALVDLAAVSAELAAKVDAALTRGGVAPPDAQSLVALTGRVTALEARRPGTWSTLTTLSGGVSAFTGWGTNRTRLENGVDIVRLELAVTNAGSTTIAAGTTLATMPTGRRPAANKPLSGITAGAGCLVQINATTGTLVSSAAIAPGGYLLCHGLFSL